MELLQSAAAERLAMRAELVSGGQRPGRPSL
jgi:hypothetical protein